MLLGYLTLQGTGLLDIVRGVESYVQDKDEKEEEATLWPDIDQTEFKMLHIYGTPEEKNRLAALGEKCQTLFGRPTYGGCDLPPFDLILKRDVYGCDMQPKVQQVRPVRQWVREIMAKGTQKGRRTMAMLHGDILRLQVCWLQRGSQEKVQR